MNEEKKTLLIISPLEFHVKFAFLVYIGKSPIANTLVMLKKKLKKTILLTELLTRRAVLV